MAEIICLDTSVLIDYFRKKNKSKTYLFSLTNSFSEFGITSITLFEIFRGSTNQQLEFWETLFKEFKIFSFDIHSARIASELDRKLRGKNLSIGIPDLFIASIALHNDLLLATLNKRHFERVENLKIFKD